MSALAEQFDADAWPRCKIIACIDFQLVTGNAGNAISGMDANFSLSIGMGMHGTQGLEPVFKGGIDIAVGSKPFRSLPALLHREFCTLTPGFIDVGKQPGGATGGLPEDEIGRAHV